MNTTKRTTIKTATTLTTTIYKILLFLLSGEASSFNSSSKLSAFRSVAILNERGRFSIQLKSQLYGFYKSKSKSILRYFMYFHYLKKMHYVYVPN